MQYFFTKKFNGTFTMTWVGEPTYTDEVSTQKRDIKTFQIAPTKSIKSITNFSDIVKGENDEHYFKRLFSYSNERTGFTHTGITYSDPAPITGITGEYCPDNPLYLNLYYYRIDTSVVTIPTLSINKIVIEGEYDLATTDEIIEVPDEGYIFEPKNIYKIFKLTGYEIYGVNTDNLKIKYRFTQDGGRTYTPWEDLTPENISTRKLNAVRFAQVQYGVTKIDNSIPSKIYDIILLGDFQNINNYYLKTNRYGIREDCADKYPQWSGATNADGTGGSSTNICLSGLTPYTPANKDNYNRDFFTAGLSCYLTGNVISNMEAENNTDTAISGNYDPYSQTQKITEWYSFLANSTNKILGWTVDYHLTDPDGKGIDKYLHEYQLFNIVDVQRIKIIVPENTFPDNQVRINEFMLDMMDTFQVIIMKDEFHKAFGIDKRPAQKDILYLCQANRFYRVRHAQVKRDIMYMGLYYNVVLEKYEKLANETNLSEASRNLIEPLTQDNTIDVLFGFDNKKEEKKIVNDQLKPTTHEVYRLEINPLLSIIKRDIYNGLKGTKIADNYYDLSSLSEGISAITYTKTDDVLEVSENRAINLWFNFNNKYDPNKIIDSTAFDSYYVSTSKEFNFLDNYDYINLKGYKLSYYNNEMIFTLNEINYILDFSGLTTNVWYGVTANLDNRQRKVSIDIFKRNYTYNVTMFSDNYQSTIVDINNQTGITYYTGLGYKPVKNTEINVSLGDNTDLLKIASVEYENIDLVQFDIDKIINVVASEIKLTNIRIFNDVIPEESKSNILLQRVVQDSDSLILADNATKQLYTSNIKNTRWE